MAPALRMTCLNQRERAKFFLNFFSCNVFSFDTRLRLYLAVVGELLLVEYVLL